MVVCFEAYIYTPEGKKSQNNTHPTPKIIVIIRGRTLTKFALGGDSMLLILQFCHSRYPRHPEWLKISVSGPTCWWIECLPAFSTPCLFNFSRKLYGKWSPTNSQGGRRGRRLNKEQIGIRLSRGVKQNGFPNAKVTDCLRTTVSKAEPPMVCSIGRIRVPQKPATVKRWGTFPCSSKS